MAKQPGRKVKLPAKATPESLEKAAYRYLERYATSRANLRRMLELRVQRSVYAHATDKNEGLAAVETVMTKLDRLNLLDDRSYAENRALSLLRRGASHQAIRAALFAKGVEEDLIRRAIEHLRQDWSDPELAAALAYVKKRRIGPFRVTEARRTNRERDLAALARRGFDYDLAQKVIDAEDVEDLEKSAAS